MGRLHLFEFEDLAWFPDFLRNYGTDYLQFVSAKTGMFKPVIPLIEEALVKSETRTIVDLGSGGGGGLIDLNPELKKKFPDLKIILTDFYPNLPAFKELNEKTNNIDYNTAPVDARRVPPDLKGLRTMFLSFHHFKPEDAQVILQNAVDSGSAIAIFEGQERSITGLIGMLFAPVFVLLSTPFIRPFKWGRIIFTYLVPVVPLFVLWDGLVSVLRTYSVKEMEALVEGLQGRGNFDWQIGKRKSGPAKILYLQGIPKK